MSVVEPIIQDNKFQEINNPKTLKEQLVDRVFGKEITNQIKQNNNNNNEQILNNNSKLISHKSRQNLAVQICQEKVTKEINNLSEEIKKNDEPLLSNDQIDYEAAEKELLKIEKIDRSNPEAVAEFQKEIFDYLRETEPNDNYMKKQTDINEKMRTILIDWLVDVHYKYKMVPETLYLTVSIIDRYLSKAQISREKLQLVGITALFISGKYEEIYPPNIKDYVEVTDNSYTKNDILDMESKILLVLQFNLTVPSTLRFFDRYSRILMLDQRAYMLGRYILELTLIDYRFLKYNPSMLASAAVYLTNKIYKKHQCWSDAVALVSQKLESQLRPCAKEFCLSLINAQDSKYQAVRRKFSTASYLEVSKIHLNKVISNQL